MIYLRYFYFVFINMQFPLESNKICQLRYCKSHWTINCTNLINIVVSRKKPTGKCEYKEIKGCKINQQHWYFNLDHPSKIYNNSLTSSFDLNWIYKESWWTFQMFTVLQIQHTSLKQLMMTKMTGSWWLF